MKVAVVDLGLSIRKAEEKISAGRAENEQTTGFILELIEPDQKSTTASIPADLKIPGHTDDYTAYRDRFANPDVDPDLGEIGKHLFDLLHFGAVGERLKDLEKKAKQTNSRLRILLDVNAQAASGENLAWLPWEFMCDRNRLPFQNSDDTIIRIHDSSPGRYVESPSWPIRLLIVIGVNDKSISWADEVVKIERALHDVNRLVDIEEMTWPTVNQLRAKCQSFRPHILHYIGHGHRNAASSIFLKGEGAERDLWSVSQIATGLTAWEWAPRFAFINACSTEGKSAVTTSHVGWSIGDAFRELGVPGVLTMQADVSGARAGDFAGVIYQSLAAGDPIDRAVAKARVQVRDNLEGTGKNDQQRDWAIPVLTLALPLEDLMPIQIKADKTRLNEIHKCQKFQEVSVLANCRTNRRNFIHGFYPILRPVAENNLVVLRGASGSGKTWVALWGLEGYALQNHDVRYIELVSSENLKWLDVLCQIQTGVADQQHQLIYRALDADAFSEFNHDLAFRIEDKIPPTWDGERKPFTKPNMNDLENLSDKTVEAIFKSFRDALVRAAQPGNPLIIVLDQLTKDGQEILTAHMKRFLIPFLFDPVAQGLLKQTTEQGVREVKIVLVVSDDELLRYPELSALEQVWYEVPLESIQATDFDKVMEEYLRNLRASNRKDIKRQMEMITPAVEQHLVNVIRGSIRNETWKAGEMGKLLDMIGIICKRV